MLIFENKSLSFGLTYFVLILFVSISHVDSRAVTTIEADEATASSDFLHTKKQQQKGEKNTQRERVRGGRKD
jgi:hypothetical protein